MSVTCGVVGSTGTAFEVLRRNDSTTASNRLVRGLYSSRSEQRIQKLLCLRMLVIGTLRKMLWWLLKSLECCGTYSKDVTSTVYCVLNPQLPTTWTNIQNVNSALL